MPAPISLLQLEPTDDATSVRDRLQFLRGRRVLLVSPESGTALTRKLDLVLIQREAMRLAIRLAVVTHDPVVARNAVELDLSVFETIGGAQRAKWRRGRSKVFSGRESRPKDEPSAEDLAPLASRLRVEDISPVARRARGLIRLAIILVLLLTVGAVTYFVAPSATVIILPQRESLEISVEITADPLIGQGQIDVEARLIPALTLRVEVEERATIETTGVRSLGTTPAVGSVVFINTTNQAVDIPQGTFISTSAGTPIIFRTLQAARVAGGVGLQIEVPIEAVAESSGEIGNNLDAGMINMVIGGLSNQLEVRNLAATYGGTSREVRVVTEADRSRLLDTLRQQLQARAYNEMVPRMGGDQIIIPETIRITEERGDWTTFDAQVGEEANNLSLTMRAVIEATAVDMRFAEQIAYVQLSNGIPPGREIDINTVDYQQSGAVSVDEVGRVRFTIIGRAAIGSQIDASALQGRLAGMSIDEASRYLITTLNLTESTPPQITVTPDWFGQLPILPMRITVLVGSG